MSRKYEQMVTYPIVFVRSGLVFYEIPIISVSDDLRTLLKKDCFTMLNILVILHYKVDSLRGGGLSVMFRGQ